MKTLIHFFSSLFISLILLVGFTTTTKAQKQKLTILNMDVNGIELKPHEAGNLVRLEMEKIDTFEITDRYDVQYMIKKKNLNIEDCYGKICQVEMGKELGSDLMLSGTIEKIAKTIIISFRLIDVSQEKIIESHVAEYLDITDELQTMVQISIRRLLELPVSKSVEEKLTKEGSYQSAVNNPNINRLNLTGPRSGVVLLSGDNASIVETPIEQGGFEASSVMYMFGYQFEVQYLNEGKYQALFEFIPTISGFTGNVFRPGLNVLNGFRNNENGWEFAFGPSFGLTSVQDVAKIDNEWVPKDNVPQSQQEGLDFKKLPYMNGDVEISTNILFAFGKTFTSGKVNLPVNVFFIPSRNGHTYGITVGFNGTSKKQPVTKKSIQWF